LAKHIVATTWLGKHRKHNMYVTTNDGRIEYVAALPDEVDAEMAKLYNDIDVLCKTKLSIEELFFFAAMIHLVFVKIHPFNDGNGRTGRLLEKWFLAQHLGYKVWFLESEKFYYTHHQSYYNNLSVLGLEYDRLDYTKALPFLLMPPNSLNKTD
jgi:Fic family protein